MRSIAITIKNPGRRSESSGPPAPGRPIEAPAPANRTRRRQRGFTMIEIALCLAIIGFGLIAIIGVLPTGLNVQRDNRQETIIDQDASVWIDAIRNGSVRYDDLTNYVIAITNYWAVYRDSNSPPTTAGYDGFTSRLAPLYGLTFGSRVTSVTGVSPSFGLIDGLRIVGLLSTPKYTPLRGGSFQSNYITAWVRAISGSAVDKLPQNDQTILRDAFTYRMITELVPYVPVNSDSFNVSLTSTNEAMARLSVVNALRVNSHDLRLMFRWPLVPPAPPGNSRQTFRVLTSGRLVPTNIFSQPNLPLYFLQPSFYEQAP